MSVGRTRVTVWSEHVRDRDDPEVRELYPIGIHGALAQAIEAHHGASAQVETSTLHDRECGLSDELLGRTDVLVLWAHVAHNDVPDERAAAVQDRVLAGMGLVVLHSANASKPFRCLMGTGLTLRFDDPDREVVWNVNPSHRIAAGLPAAFVIPEHEVYCEYFDIPIPDELVFLSTFGRGGVFRSGCCFSRGAGRIFYFSPGHERQPVYHQREVRMVIANATAWAAPTASAGVVLAEDVYITEEAGGPLWPGIR